MRSEALRVYREVLKATRKTFAGDTEMLKSSAMEVRSKFEENRNLTSESDIKSRLDDARLAGKFISTMLLQARLNERGDYEVKPSKEHEGGTLEIPTEEMLKKA